jgi:creatinine amidohydrolase
MCKYLMVLSFLASAAVAAPGHRLAELTWPEAEQRLQSAPLVIIPFAAAAKEHGAHLPMNADEVVMNYLLEAAINELPVIVAPPVLHGWMPAFREFPGTGIADPVVFQNYMLEVSRSLLQNGARRLVYLNTGISKASGLPIAIVAREVRVQYGVPTLVVSWDDLETAAVGQLAEQREGGHGDEIETSIQLYLQPERVDMSAAVRDYGPANPQDYAGYRPGLFSREPGDPDHSITGIYGDPTLATADKGRAALELMRAAWLQALRGFADSAVRRD